MMAETEAATEAKAKKPRKRREPKPGKGPVNAVPLDEIQWARIRFYVQERTAAELREDQFLGRTLGRVAAQKESHARHLRGDQVDEALRMWCHR
jgi:hypothetical protein